MADEQTRAAVALLSRVLRPEPRLHLGAAEAEQLAPLVTRWLARGATPADLAHALLPGLPTPLHSAAAVLRSRLERKLPPLRPVAAAPRYSECGRCHDPVPKPGLCAPCTGLPPRPGLAVVNASTARRGAAQARAALLATRRSHASLALG